jgi:hypothetical protein
MFLHYTYTYTYVDQLTYQRQIFCCDSPWFNPGISDTVESEGWQIKQCRIKYLTLIKMALLAPRCRMA